MSSGWQGWLGVSQLEPPESAFKGSRNNLCSKDFFFCMRWRRGLFFETRSHINQVSLTL